MPKTARKDAATELAEKMVLVLQAQRLLGEASYPLTLRRLGELTDPAASEEQVRKAVAKKKPFGERAIAIQPKNLDSPVALAEDVEQLARSPAVLLFALELVCSADAPTCAVSKPKSKIPPKLKRSFDARVKQRLEDNDLPPGVAVIEVKKKKLFHLQRYPLPAPPPPPELVLADNLVRMLQTQRQLGGASYPLTLTRLIELTQPGAKSTLVKKAIAQKVFREAVVQALNQPDSPIALTEDRDRLLASDLLLETILRRTRTATNQVFTLAALKTKVVKVLQKPLEEALKQRVANRSLPPGVGCLLQKQKPMLFLLSDVFTAPVASPNPPPALEPPAVQDMPPSRPPGPSPDFARAFDEAFERLDRERGSHNFVSLVYLRQALGLDRQTFDTELMNLRRAGRYTLSAAEGRHGISPVEQEAGIYEAGSLLLYVSRKLS